MNAQSLEVLRHANKKLAGELALRDRMIRILEEHLECRELALQDHERVIIEIRNILRRP